MKFSYLRISFSPVSGKVCFYWKLPLMPLLFPKPQHGRPDLVFYTRRTPALFLVVLVATHLFPH
jgi:hypothetical protein